MKNFPHVGMNLTLICDLSTVRVNTAMLLGLLCSVPVLLVSAEEAEMPTFQNARLGKIHKNLMRTEGKDMLLGDPIGIPTRVGISLADGFPHWGRENQEKISRHHLFHEAVCVPAFT